MEKQNPLSTEQIVDRLNEIEKEKLTDRQFFYEVLCVINEIKNTELAEEDFTKISQTLNEIGCVDFETWKKEKLTKGITAPKVPMQEGIENGSLSTGAVFIDTFLIDYEHAKNALRIMASNDETGKPRLEKLLENYEAILKGIKPDLDDYLENSNETYILMKEKFQLKAQIYRLQKREEELNAELEELMPNEKKANRDFEEI